MTTKKNLVKIMLMSIATAVCFSFGACSNEDDPVAAARETAAAEIPANVPGDAKTGRIPKRLLLPVQRRHQVLRVVQDRRAQRPLQLKTPQVGSFFAIYLGCWRFFPYLCIVQYKER